MNEADDIAKLVSDPSFSVVMLGIVGVILLNLLYLSVAVVLKLATSVRMSFASLIASYTMTWMSKIIILAPAMAAIQFYIPHIMESKWVSASGMLMMVLMFISWLFAFQPKSLQQLTIDSLYKVEMKKNSLLLELKKNEWKQALKENNQEKLKIADLDISRLRDERRGLRIQHATQGILGRLIKQNKRVEEKLCK